VLDTRAASTSTRSEQAETCTDDSAGATRPVRVMHVIYRLQFGGTELGLIKLVNALNRSRVASSICSCRPADGVKTRLSNDVALFELIRREGNDPLLVLRLARLMRRERPDVVHSHAWGTLCEGLVAARLAGVPIVVHGEHGTLDLRPRNVRVQRWAWGRVDRVLSVSSQLTDRMASGVGFPASRITTIRNGVDLSRFAMADRGAARAALGLASDDFVVGTVGRLVPVKNQRLLLESLALLNKKGLRFRAVITGEGPLSSKLESSVDRLGLNGLVHFTGLQTNVADVLAAFDVFALPSNSEGLSNTIQEAMATGLPVVATRVGGAAELVEEGRTGLLTPPRDAIALATALETLANNKNLRASMGRAGRLRAEREFALSRMVRNYEDLYCDLAWCGARRSRRPVAVTNTFSR